MDRLQSIRKEHYGESDIVVLWPAPLFEGPHPSDFDQPQRLAVVCEVMVHRENADWILGYNVLELTELPDEGWAFEPLYVKSIAGAALGVPARTRAMCFLERREYDTALFRRVPGARPAWSWELLARDRRRRQESRAAERLAHQLGTTVDDIALEGDELLTYMAFGRRRA